MSQLSPSFNPSPLHAYDDEPVHLGERIQPHGVLLVLESVGWTIVKASQNSADYLNHTPNALIGTALSSWLEPHSIALIKEHQRREDQRPLYLSLTFALTKGAKRFDTYMHQVNESVILELEPGHELTAVELTSIQHSVTQSIAHLRTIPDLTQFLQAAVEAIQILSGYERVMIYQFDEQQAGSVVAETQATNGQAYLGLHYPATDIPKRVRDLYQQGMMRLVPHLSAPPVVLHSRHSLAQALPQGDRPNPDESAKRPSSHHSDCPTDSPINLSRSILRAVDPCCVDYHQNMGVEAFWVIALVNSGTLWGLIACHHSTAKPVPVPIRMACETLGQLIAAEVTSKIREEDIAYLNSLKVIQSDFVSSIAEAEDFKQALIHPQPRLLDLVSAKGAIVCLDQDVTLVGQTPNRQEVQALIEWTLSCEAHNSLFHTSCLSDHYPDAQTFKEKGSGVLILTISRLRRYLIIWFRPEVIQTVNWAGDPTTAVRTIENEQGQITLGPRSSFTQWKEMVTATALPWKKVELENALDLKNAIVGIVLNKADKLAQVNLELARSNRELDSFAYAASHDLKEPLRGITNFSNIIIRRYADKLDEAGVKRLKTLVRLAQRMDMLIDALLQFSRLGQTDLNRTTTDLDQLLQKVIDDMTTGWSDERLAPLITVVKPLPTMRCDAVLISDVFSNLISNAAKYTDHDRACIEIGWLWPQEYNETHLESNPDLLSEPPTYILEGRVQAPILYVKDQGIGIQKRHFQNIFKLFKRLHERDRYGGGSGVGLTITQRIIERHNGHIWVGSTYGTGTTFYFTLGLIT